MASGILDLPPPETDIPGDREELQYCLCCPSELDAEALQKLEEGAVLSCSEYYGIPHLWKQTEGVYRGVLLQYREVTENETFATAGEALAWYHRMNEAVEG